MQYAQSYVNGVYDYSKVKNVYEENLHQVPETRNNFQEFSNITTGQPDECKVEEDLEDYGMSGNQDQGKDKIIAYASDTESEPGDPRHRVGSRFSSHLADSKNKTIAAEDIASPVEDDIPEALNQ